MHDYERERVRQWLRANRGDTPQEQLAADITATTGWTITRDRYSKYESGSTPFGREVLAHLVDYWTRKGKPAPDLQPPVPEVSLEERAVLAAERQADAIAALVAELREWRQADRDRIGGLEQTVEGLLVAVAPLERGDGARREPFAPRR